MILLDKSIVYCSIDYLRKKFELIIIFEHILLNPKCYKMIEIYPLPPKKAKKKKYDQFNQCHYWKLNNIKYFGHARIK